MKSILLLFFLPISTLCLAQIPADSAKYYVGKKVEVCGKVTQVGGNYHINTPSSLATSFITVLFFGDNKNISFIIQMPGGLEKSYLDEKKKYLDSTVCVSGIITLTLMPGDGHGVPTITIDSLNQVKFH